MLHRAGPKFAIAIKMDASTQSHSILRTAVQTMGGKTPIGAMLTTLVSFLRLLQMSLRLYVPLVNLDGGKCRTMSSKC